MSDGPLRLIGSIARVAWAALGRLSRPGWLALLLCAAASIAGSVTHALLIRWPTPRVTDEFSHLLLADTLRHGRLANPTHPMWMHFETFHVLHEPNYVSMYPPGQGFVLAVGWVLGGHPIVGVWLGGALMAAAACWMLRGFVPPRWALVGGLITAAHFGMTKDWTQSYFGGCVAATGGALVAGALPRICRRDHRAAPWWLALGLVILANTRPFEGIVLLIPALVVLVAEVVRRARSGRRGTVVRVVAPPLIAVAGILGWMAFYNQSVMGDPLRFPYIEHQKRYCVASPVLWLPARPVPSYRHEPMRKLWAELNYGECAAQQTLAGFLDQLPRKLGGLWRWYLGWGLSVGLLGLPCFLRRRWSRLALVSVILLFATVLTYVQALAQYPSPGVAWVALLVTGGLRELSHVRVRGFRWGNVFVLAATAVILVRPALTIATRNPTTYDWRRSTFIAELQADGGRHLVIVRYGPYHDPRAELVWNEADIDAAGVVWARDLGPGENRRLVEYFAGRKAWLLEVDFAGEPMRLSPYPR